MRNYIVKTLRDLQWHIEEDAFEDDTPYGRKKFTNVIATKDPDAPRRIILAAHFDSKYFPNPPENQVCGSRLVGDWDIYCISLVFGSDRLCCAVRNAIGPCWGIESDVG